MRPRWTGADLPLSARDQALWERASDNIAKNRQGALIVRVVDGYGQPMAGVPVRYEQTEHAFLLGVHYPYHARAYDLFTAAGVNATSLFMGWSHVQPRPGLFNWGYLDQVWNPTELKRRRLRLTAQALNWFKAGWNVTPGYLADVEPSRLPELVYDHVQTLLSRWAPYIDRCEIINEPLWREANALGLSLDQVVHVAHAAGLAVRDTLPQAEIEVSFCEISRVETYETSPFDLLDALDAAEVPYDTIGLQALENGYTHTQPPTYFRSKTFSGMFQMLHRYAAVGKPLHVVALAVPSERAPQATARHYRPKYGPWEPELQARYLDAIYTLLFADASVRGITWWSPVDGRLALVPNGGLLGEDLSIKPSYRALRDWTQRHTSSGLTRTEEDGRAVLHAYEGEYRLSIGQGEFGVSVTERVELPTVRDTTVVLARPGQGAD